MFFFKRNKKNVHSSNFTWRPTVILYLLTFIISCAGVGNYQSKSTSSSISQRGDSSDLLVASLQGDSGKVRRLIRNGAYVNTKTEEGITPVMMAAQNGNTEIIEILIEHGANVNATSNERAIKGYTALMLAAQNGHPEIANILIGNGANIDAKTHDGVTALHIACRFEHLPVVKTLVENGAAVNTVDNQNMPPLISAINSGNFPITEILVEHGANVNFKYKVASDVLSSINNSHPLYGNILGIARDINNERIIDLLLEHGAKNVTYINMPAFYVKEKYNEAEQIPDNFLKLLNDDAPLSIQIANSNLTNQQLIRVFDFAFKNSHYNICYSILKSNRVTRKKEEWVNSLLNGLLFLWSPDWAGAEMVYSKYKDDDEVRLKYEVLFNMKIYLRDSDWITNQLNNFSTKVNVLLNPSMGQYVRNPIFVSMELSNEKVFKQLLTYVKEHQVEYNHHQILAAISPTNPLENIPSNQRLKFLEIYLNVIDDYRGDLHKKLIQGVLCIANDNIPCITNLINSDNELLPYSKYDFSLYSVAVELEKDPIASLIINTELENEISRHDFELYLENNMYSQKVTGNRLKKNNSKGGKKSSSIQNTQADISNSRVKKSAISQGERNELVMNLIAKGNENIINWLGVHITQLGDSTNYTKLVHAGLNVNYIDELPHGDGHTLLHYAAKGNNTFIIDDLISQGVPIEKKTYHDGYTPLWIAVREGNIEAVKILFSHGADPSIETAYGGNPIEFARRWEKNEILKVLLKN